MIPDVPVTTYHRARNWVLSGKLAGTRIDGHWAVDRSSVEAARDALTPPEAAERG